MPLQKFLTMKGARHSKIDMKQLKLVKELEVKAERNREQATNSSRMKQQVREEVAREQQ